MNTHSKVLMLILVLVIALGGASTIMDDGSDAAPAMPEMPVVAVFDGFMDMMPFEIPESYSSLTPVKTDQTISENTEWGDTLLEDITVTFSNDAKLTVAANKTVVIKGDVDFVSSDSRPITIELKDGARILVGGFDFASTETGQTATVVSGAAFTLSSSYTDSGTEPAPGIPDLSFTGAVSIDMTQAYAEKPDMVITVRSAAEGTPTVSEACISMLPGQAKEVSVSMVIDADKFYAEISKTPDTVLTPQWYVAYVSDPDKPAMSLDLDISVGSFTGTDYAPDGKSYTDVNEVADLTVAVDTASDAKGLRLQLNAEELRVIQCPGGVADAKGAKDLFVSGLKTDIRLDTSLIAELSFGALDADIMAVNPENNANVVMGKTDVSVTADVKSFFDTLAQVNAIPPADFATLLAALMEKDSEGNPVIDTSRLLMGAQVDASTEMFLLNMNDRDETDRMYTLGVLTAETVSVQANLTAETVGELGPGTVKMSAAGFSIMTNSMDAKGEGEKSTASELSLSVSDLMVNGHVDPEHIQPLVAALIASDETAPMADQIKAVISALIYGFEGSAEMSVNDLKANTRTCEGVAYVLKDPEAEVPAIGDLGLENWKIINKDESFTVAAATISGSLSMDTVPVSDTDPGAGPVSVGLSVDTLSFSLCNKGGAEVMTDSEGNKSVEYATYVTMDVSAGAADIDLTVNLLDVIALLGGTPPSTEDLGIDALVQVTDLCLDLDSLIANTRSLPGTEGIKRESTEVSAELDSFILKFAKQENIPALLLELSGASGEFYHGTADSVFKGDAALKETRTYSVKSENMTGVFALDSLRAGMDFDMTPDLEKDPEETEEEYQNRLQEGRVNNAAMMMNAVMMVVGGSMDPAAMAEIVQNIQFEIGFALEAAGLYVDIESEEELGEAKLEPSQFESICLLPIARSLYGTDVESDAELTVDLDVLGIDGAVSETGLSMTAGIGSLQAESSRVYHDKLYEHYYDFSAGIDDLDLGLDISAKELPTMISKLLTMVSGTPITLGDGAVVPEPEPEPEPEPPVTIFDLLFAGTHAEVTASWKQLEIEQSDRVEYTANVPFDPAYPDVRIDRGDVLPLRTIRISMGSANEGKVFDLKMLLDLSSTEAVGEVPAGIGLKAAADLTAVPGTELCVIQQKMDYETSYIYSEDRVAIKDTYYVVTGVDSYTEVRIKDPSLHLLLTAQADKGAPVTDILSSAALDLDVGIASLTSIAATKNMTTNETEYAEFWAEGIRAAYEGQLIREGGFSLDGAVLVSPEDLLTAEGLMFRAGTVEFDGTEELGHEDFLYLMFDEVSLSLSLDTEAMALTPKLTAGTVSGFVTGETDTASTDLTSGNDLCFGPGFTFSAEPSGALTVSAETYRVGVGPDAPVSAEICSEVMEKMFLASVMKGLTVGATVDSATINEVPVSAGTVVGVGDESLFTDVKVNGESISSDRILLKGDAAVTSAGLTVTMIDQGAASYIYVDAGSVLMMPDPADRPGYRFGGWFTDDGLFQVPAPKLMPETELTVFAKWIAVTYSIAYDTAGGDPIETVTGLEYMESVTLAVPVKADAQFIGWQFGTKILKGTIEMLPQDLELKAVWKTVIGEEDITQTEGTASMSTDSSSMSLTEAVISSKLKTDEVTGLDITVGGTRITMSRDSFDRLSGNGDLNITAMTLDSLSDEMISKLDLQRLAKYGLPLSYLAINVETKGCTDGLGEVWVNLPFDPEGMDLDRVVILYIEDNTGAIVEMNDYIYDPVAKNVKFKTNHFSTFAAVPKEKPVITVDPGITGGSVVPSLYRPNVGQTVTLTVTPGTGKMLESLSYCGEGQEPVPITGLMFQMPEYDITISAVFTDAVYNVTAETPVGGTLSVSAATAKMGETVTITAVPSEGKQLKSLMYVVAGSSAGTIIEGSSFVMPAGDVTVKAVFEDIPAPAPENKGTDLTPVLVAAAGLLIVAGVAAYIMVKRKGKGE